MASVQELTDSIQALNDALTADFAKIQTEVTDLQNQIAANGGKIDPSALDSLKVSIDAATARVNAFDPEQQSS